ncbi:MAG: PEGA domain-containing protein, partial [Bradymonadaceae bacterium]
PEQITGSSVDQRADVYSLGIVFYWMLTGRKPFHGSRASIVYDQIHADPPPLALQLPQGTRVSDNLVELIERCLSKDPAERPRSAADLQARLEETTDEIRADAVPTDERRDGQQGAMRSRRETPGASASQSQRHSSAQSQADGGTRSMTAETGRSEPGTESAEIVDEYQTDDRQQPIAPEADDSEMTVQEALQSARETAGSAEAVETEERGDASDGIETWWAVATGAVLALAILGGGAWYLASAGGDGSSTTKAAAERGAASAEEDESTEAIRDNVEAIDQLITAQQFDAAADRVDELSAELERKDLGETEAEWQRAIKVRRLYIEAERQRLAGEIEAAKSTYAELLNVEPEYRDAVEKLKTLEGYGLLKVEADAPVRVKVDGRAVGETPLSKPLSPGKHEVLLEVDGETSWTRTVTVGKDETVSLAPVLAPERSEEIIRGGAGTSGTAEKSKGSEPSEPSGASEKSKGAEPSGTAEKSKGSEPSDKSGQSERAGAPEPSGESTSSGESAPVQPGESKETDQGTELLEPGAGTEKSAPTPSSGGSETDESDDDTNLLPVQ